ncbi:MAG: DUF2231 domain-containing protein [Fimbriimonadaceae bacterium]
MKGYFVIVAIAAATLAPAEAEFLDTLVTKYKFADGSLFGEKACAGCHISDSDFGFNLFGKQVKQKMAEGNDKTLTPAILASLEGLDADGDGKTNGEELRAGGLPGFADGAGSSASAPAAELTGATKPASFPPKNGYHPALVHFPIALLIAGLLLDLAGLIRKEKMLLFAGWYNLVLAAVTSIAAVASGFLAMTLMKLPYKGLIFTHLLLGIGVTFVMWMMVALRVHRHEQMQVGARVAYYVLATTAFTLVTWAGHLGGKFVYGD